MNNSKTWMKQIAIILFVLISVIGYTTKFSGVVLAAGDETDDFSSSTTIGAGTGIVVTLGTSTLPANITLDGTNQKVDFDLPFDLKDDRGTGAGWHVAMWATQFSTINSHSLPTNALLLKNQPASATPKADGVDGGNSGVSTTNSASAGANTAIPSVVGSALTFFQSVADTTGALGGETCSVGTGGVCGYGMGTFTITPAMTLYVPANIYLDAAPYTATIHIETFYAP
jgi:hypothetical protein